METKKPRGFAALSQEQRWAIASKGGRTAHRRGVAHEWTHEESKAAGRKGGLARVANLRRRKAAERNASHEQERDETT